MPLLKSAPIRKGSSNYFGRSFIKARPTVFPSSRQQKLQEQTPWITFATMATDPSSYKLNHTMLRVKDPQASVKFYSFLGLSQINKMSFPDNKFDLYFLAYDGPSALSKDAHWTARPGVLELTHNYGSEDDPDFKINNGNEEPHRGFGHIAIAVDNIQAACQRIEDAGYRFQKKLTEGKMRHIAFVKDPDGYWVEIIPQTSIEKTADVKETDPSKYIFNHSMLRIKDNNVSLKYYQDVFGMTLLRSHINEKAGFNIYFLGYEKKPEEKETSGGVSLTAGLEGLLELTYNYGTEKEDGQVYHDGNKEPQGFGHICVSVDDLDAACKRFEELEVNWKKRLTDGRMKNVAFILDPDGYWIEVIQNEKVKRSSNW